MTASTGAATDGRTETDAPPPMLDLALTSLGGEPSALFDAVRRNVTEAAVALAQVTGVTFRCGCQATLSTRGGAAGGPWRVMAWNDSRCASAAHRALKAKWESSNLS